MRARSGSKASTVTSRSTTTDCDRPQRTQPRGDLAWASLDEPGVWHPILRTRRGRALPSGRCLRGFRGAEPARRRAAGASGCSRDGPSGPSRLGAARPWPVDGELTALSLGDNPEFASTALLVTQESFIQPRATYAVDPSRAHPPQAPAGARRFRPRPVSRVARWVGNAVWDRCPSRSSAGPAWPWLARPRLPLTGYGAILGFPATPTSRSPASASSTGAGLSSFLCPWGRRNGPGLV